MIRPLTHSCGAGVAVTHSLPNTDVPLLARPRGAQSATHVASACKRYVLLPQIMQSPARQA